VRIGSERTNPTAEVAACEIVCFLRFNLRLLGCGFGSDRINFDWRSRSLRDRFFSRLDSIFVFVGCGVDMGLVQSESRFLSSVVMSCILLCFD